MATGWYRRSPVPYVELRTLTAGGEAYRCYVYAAHIVVSVLLLLGGGIAALALF